MSNRKQRNNHNNRPGGNNWNFIPFMVEGVVKNKILSTVGLAIVAFVGALLSPLRANIYQYFWPPSLEISVINYKKEICEDCELRLGIRLDQKSRDKIGPGTLDVKLGNHLSFEDEKQSSALIPEFQGSINPFPDRLSIRTDRGYTGPTWVELKYSNRGYEAIKKIALTIVPRNAEKTPFIVTTDTNRVNLSGEWSFNVGADHGTMSIMQTTDSKIHGSYEFSEVHGEKGTIAGFKDGTTFRVFFYKNEQDVRKRRIEGIFQINSTDKNYIEIKGCAYGIEKDISVVTDSESTERCTRLKNYVGWRGISVTEFYASSVLKR